MERCRAAFVGLPSRTSRLQQDVSALLAKVASGVQEERTPEGYSLDVVGVVGGVAFGVEVDGPSHFFPGTRQPTGATLLKRRQLRHFGTRLVVVPYWEWWDSGRSEERRSYLEQLVAEACEQ